MALVPTALLGACASRRPDEQAVRRRQEAVDAMRRVEVIHNSEPEIPIVDLGGSGLAGLSGVFGLPGLLLGVGADAASKLSAGGRADTRSKEFTDAAQRSLPDQNLPVLCAQRVADLLRGIGREVKVTAAARAVGSSRLADSSLSIPVTPGFAALILRITAGYGAQSATSSYRPLIAIESVLRQADGALVHEDAIRRNGDDPSYLTYSGLLADHRSAFNGLRTLLLQAAEVAFEHQFSVAPTGVI